MKTIEFKYNNCSYIAYEDGRIYSKHFKRFLKTFKNGLKNIVFVGGKAFAVDKIINTLFNEIGLPNELVYHKNEIFTDDRANNLKWMSRGDYLRLVRKRKRKLIGIYKWGIGHKKYRVVIKIDKKAKTIGYFNKRSDAIDAYINAYNKQYSSYLETRTYEV